MVWPVWEGKRKKSVRWSGHMSGEWRRERKRKRERSCDINLKAGGRETRREGGEADDGAPRSHTVDTTAREL